MLEECHKEQDWADVGRAWQSCLLRQGIAVRRIGEERWWLSLGDLGGHVAMGWPLTQEGPCLVPQQKVQSKDLRWLVAFGPEAWEAMGLEAQAPLARMVQQGSRAGQGIGMLQPKPTELLKLAASEGFWTLQVTFLARLRGHLGLPAPAKGNVASELVILVTNIAPDLQFDATIGILHKRLKRPSQWNAVMDLLASEENNDMLTSEDRELLKDATGDHIAKGTPNELIVREIGSWVAKKRAARGSAASSKGTSAGRGGGKKAKAPSASSGAPSASDGAAPIRKPMSIGENMVAVGDPS